MAEGIRIGGGSKPEGLNVWAKGNYTPAKSGSFTFAQVQSRSKFKVVPTGLDISDITLDTLKTKKITERNSNYFYYFDANATKVYKKELSMSNYETCSYDDSTGIITYSGYALFDPFEKNYIPQTHSLEVPAKFEVISFVIDDDPNAYPNGAVHTDGYYYELLGQVSSANVMSLSDTTLMTVQQDYRDQIETEVSNANS